MNSSGLVLDLPTSGALKDELGARKRYATLAKTEREVRGRGAKARRTCSAEATFNREGL